MNIQSAFLSSLISAPKLSQKAAPEDFLGRIFPEDAQVPASFPHLLSAGKIIALSPWSFDIKDLDCYLFLYTQKGCGKLLQNSQVHTLSEASLLFWDCRQRFRVDIAVSPWEYQILFLKGDILSYYLGLLPAGKVPLIHAPSGSGIALGMEFLINSISPSGTGRRLLVSDQINHIAIQCITTLLGKENTASRLPSYIKNIRDLFDRHFQNTYTLDTLAEQFGVNKYRLCREFKAAYQISPLQYLNQQRIRQSAALLLSTDYKIHEIGSMVGIENTNHFIFLFKRFYGTTPLEYKERMVL